jgi:hypothetical protein
VRLLSVRLCWKSEMKTARLCLYLRWKRGIMEVLFWSLGAAALQPGPFESSRRDS